MSTIIIFERRVKSFQNSTFTLNVYPIRRNSYLMKATNASCWRTFDFLELKNVRLWKAKCNLIKTLISSNSNNGYEMEIQYNNVL